MSTGRPTQAESILSDLIAGAQLSPLDALNYYGCMRLGARIFDLREEGWQISRRMEHNDRGKHYAVYYLSDADRARNVRKIAREGGLRRLPEPAHAPFRLLG